MKENKLVALSIDFAIKTIKLCENIKGHYSLVNQLERSSTSIGANIYKANYAHGKPDFIAKLQIALKECQRKQLVTAWTKAMRNIPNGSMIIKLKIIPVI